MTSGADAAGSILGRVTLENQLPMQLQLSISSQLLSPQTQVIFWQNLTSGDFRVYREAGGGQTRQAGVATLATAGPGKTSKLKSGKKMHRLPPNQCQTNVQTSLLE